MRGGTWCRLALLGAAWRCLVVFNGAGGSGWRLVVLNGTYLFFLRCLVVLGDARAAWWCLVVQCAWLVLFGAAWRCVVALGGAW